MNRTVLWCTLLFVAFAVAFPTIQLILDPRPVGDAVQDYFRRGIDLQGGTRLVYGVDREDTSVTPEQVTRVLTKRIDPTGTRNYPGAAELLSDSEQPNMAGAMEWCYFYITDEQLYASKTYNWNL